jgi:LAO/AO transport system kinase
VTAGAPVGVRSRRTADVPALVAQAGNGEARAVGRLISLVEDASPALREVMALLAPQAGHARVIGLTGSPGVGKSTSTSALVAAYRRRGMRVGVLAVDPSSPFSGGALLGDRVRMQDHATDDGVFIRSMASRGHLGGLSWATPQALRVLSAAGCDVVLIETVGVGQAEVEVASLADTTLVLLAPGMGDGIQAAKAGILEVADVFVVNKADRDGADQVVRDLRYMQSLGTQSPSQAKVEGKWVAPVLKTVAARGEGVEEVVDAVERHGVWLAETGELQRRRARRASDEVEAIALTVLRDRMGDLRGGNVLEGLAARVVAGELDPYAAADALVEAVTA